MKIQYIGHSGFLVTLESCYLLSYDIKLNSCFFRRHPEAAALQEQGRLYSLRMDEHYVIDGLEIDPLKSTDEGVAFLSSPGSQAGAV